MAKSNAAARLGQYRTTDNLFLPLLHFETPRKTKRAAIWLHGMGSSGSFYAVERINALAEELAKVGIALIAPNNRGAGIAQSLSTVDEAGEPTKVVVGTSHELIRDVIHDIAGLLRYARRAGYREFYLIGHSTGANKICVYNFSKPSNPFRAYVLFGGADDTGLHVQQLGLMRYRWVLRRCRRAVRRGYGHRLVPRRWRVGIFSYQSLLDMLKPDGDYNVFPFWEARHKPLSRRNLWRFWQALRKPMLVVYGEQDEYCQPDTEACVRLLKKFQVPGMEVDYRIIQDADHSATGHERKLAKTIATWLKSK